MRPGLLDYLCCPSCKGDLQIEKTYTETQGHILEGDLKCSQCLGSYPIKRGIPRLLSVLMNDKDRDLGTDYQSYFDLLVPKDEYTTGIVYGRSPEDEVLDFCKKMRVPNLNFLQEKVLLDACCGMARFEEALSKKCKDVIAFDISGVVERAFESWKHLPNVHVVQMDLCHIAIKPACLDVVWCDGGLPYTSDLRKSVSELLRVRKSKSIFFTWCYNARKTWPEVVGRVFFLLHLPMALRFRAIQITLLPLLVVASIIKLRPYILQINDFAQTVLDWSLAARVNHVSRAEVTQILLENGAGDFIVEELGLNVEFRSPTMNLET